MIHTEVPEILANKGIGHKLVREALEWVEKEGIAVVPLCPFVRGYLKENLDDYRDIIAEGVKL